MIASKIGTRRVASVTALAVQALMVSCALESINNG